MTVLWIVTLCSPLYFMVTGVITAVLNDVEWISGFNFLNPVQFYYNESVNWFGAYFITLTINILFAPYAIVYWIYKLCTVGRK